MPMAGSGVGDSNPRLRFLVLVFLSTVTFGVLMFWRDKYIYSQDYVEVPTTIHHASKEKLKPSTTTHTEETRKELTQ